MKEAMNKMEVTVESKSNENLTRICEKFTKVKVNF